MKKRFGLLVFVSAIYILVLTIRIILDSIGIVHIGDFEGFAVDSRGNLYLGYIGGIEVYHDGELVRTIEPPTNKGFIFTIVDDKLIIGREVSRKVGAFDLYGTYLDTYELDFYTLEHAIRQTKEIEQNGRHYTIKKYFGLKPFEIICDGVVVYRRSTIDYILCGLPFWLFLGFIFFCFFYTVPFLATNGKKRFFFR